jgi:large subunit ribosomal protein L25
MSNLSLKISKRTETGKNANNRLRASGYVPVNIISNGESLSGKADESEVNKILSMGIRPATLIDLDLDGSSTRVYVKEIQRFPGTGRIRHIDFYKVTPGRKIVAKIGIKTTGTAKGAKAGGQFVHVIHEIKVKSSPEDLIDLITLDVTNLEVGQAIKVSELPVPKSWEILLNGDPIVTSVNKTKALLAAERSEKMAATGKEAGKKGKAPAAKKK